MIVRFRCGHDETVEPDKTISPSCQQCGERRIAFVRNVEPPRFVGHARGPRVQEKHLGPIAVTVAKTPLTLQESSDGQ